MAIFHSYVCLPEGNNSSLVHENQKTAVTHGTLPFVIRNAARSLVNIGQPYPQLKLLRASPPLPVATWFELLRFDLGSLGTRPGPGSVGRWCTFNETVKLSNKIKHMGQLSENTDKNFCLFQFNGKKMEKVI